MNEFSNLENYLTSGIRMYMGVKKGHPSPKVGRNFKQAVWVATLRKWGMPKYQTSQFYHFVHKHK